ncbi:MAG: bifunctional hydroxymethylpyrimidine kinase/phosphomethylpyrimidine kinase, partial [Methanobacteriaceae archaeon]
MIGITIAGFDPSGGAGILNDVKTFQALDIYPTSVITTLTAQNPKKVFDLEPVSIEFIKKQLDSVLTYYEIEFGKTGMLYSSEVIKLVGSYIDDYDLKIVVDPV